MEPVSAVGLASSILTFVEFAWDLIGGAVEVYRSANGNLDENARLDDVKDDLDSLADAIAAKPVRETRAERRIARIAEDCHADSKALQKLLREVAGPGNNRAIWKSLKSSWMSIRSRKDVVELKARLQEYRSAVLLHVAFLLSDEQSSINLGIAQLRDDCSQLKIAFRTQITSTQKRILGAINTLTKSTEADHETSGISTADISKMLLTIQDLVDDTYIQHRILRQLVFEDMHSRADQIPEATKGTYSWTFEENEVIEEVQHRRVWKSFLDWLGSENKILHVSGNPGSGKSTLMKFLSQHKKTKEQLQVWAKTDTPIFCVFYFWNPGSKMQRTITGLYRSLLFQALSQCPELTEHVFPVQFRMMRASVGDMMVERIQSFGEDRIEEAFNLLLERASAGGYRLCFFIDGLDECEGNRLQHEDLANMLQTWVTPDKIKMCVSSRPYSEFLRPFNLLGNWLIQLHELNEPDIRAYCLNRLENDIDAREREDLCQRLVDTVVKNAQGVFLWVHLVVDVLLEGFRQDDPDSVLEAQLKALPSDIDKLYTKLREPFETDSIQRVRSNRMLLLAAHCPWDRGVSAIAFSWLEEQGCDRRGLINPDFPPVGKIEPYSDEQTFRRLGHVTKQIDGLARGFLEVWRDETEIAMPFFRLKVRFCHRTARDYLLQNEDRRRALLDSFPSFENSHPYGRICLAETSHGWRHQIPSDYHCFDKFDLSSRQNLDPDLVGNFDFPIQALVTPMMTKVAHSLYLQKHSWHTHSTQVSLLVYAAYCGLTRFVLREIYTDPTRLGEGSVCGSILVAAVNRAHYDLASTLLTMDRGVNELCVVFDDDGDVQGCVPASVIATAHFLDQALGFRSPREMRAKDGWLDMVRNLLKLNYGLNISMWATIRRVDIFRGESISRKETGVRLRLEVAEVVTLLEAPTSAVKDYKTEPPDSWVTDAVQGSRSGEASRVNSQGTSGEQWGLTSWLKDWIDQPDIESNDRTDLADRALCLEDVEWSSGRQELVRLSGWTRLY